MIQISRISNKDALRTCKRYHYSKTIPCASVFYGIWENKKYLGLVGFGYGNSPVLGKKEGFKTGEICELVRIAMSGKQEKQTSYYVMSVIKEFKRTNKNIVAIYSFCDTGKNHIGILYQACNFIYIDRRPAPHPMYKIRGKIIHAWSIKKSEKKIATVVPCHDKLLYVYPLCRTARKKLIKFKKNYPARS